MCRLFTQKSNAHAIARDFGAEIEPELPDLFPNKSPTDWALVVRRHPKTGKRWLGAARFGLIPYWVKDAARAKQMQRQTFNARSESIANKPAFSSASGEAAMPYPH